MQQPVVSRNPDVMGGTPVFAGTRVPVQTLLDYLEAGGSIDEFLEGFPSVTREQVIAFLEQAKDRLVESVSGGSYSTNAWTGDCCAKFPVTR
jgi:uncharacterized protein (DUF433 family)